MKKSYIEGLGWVGTIAILAAYILVNFSLLTPSSLWSLLLNGTGAIAIACEAYSKKDYQPVVLNVIWAAVAVVGMARFVF